jgi:RNA recognition motif-containing protein
MNIFVAKLNYDTNDSDLIELFEQFGEVSSARVNIDRETGRSKGFGFVEMPNDDEAKNAINSLNETEVDGMVIVVNEARPREDRPRNTGFSSNRGGGGGYGNNNRGGGGGNRNGGGGNSGGYNKKW